MNHNSKFSVRDICYAGLFAAVIAVMAQISIPMPLGVPMTMQTFAITLAAVVLGSKLSAIATLVYLLLGAVGVPVLANFQGGPSAIFGKTGGYAIGYILAALLTALLTKALGRKFWSLCVAMVVGCAACYVLGTAWFVFQMQCELGYALSVCVYPFIALDLAKIVVSCIVGALLRKRLVQAGVLKLKEA